MGEKTEISWCHATFNPWWGCTRVSPGCVHCYAETFAKRVGVAWGPQAERRFFGDKHWNEPLKWNRLAEKAGARRRVFCASMADVFEDRPELAPQRARLFDLIAATPWLDWLLLTKRPENAAKMVPASWVFGWPRNVWAMTTAEDQQRADERIPHLLRLPAAVRGLSCEPLLGPVDLRAVVMPDGDSLGVGLFNHHEGGLDWVVVGGESGHSARPMHPEWARSLRDQCQAAGVAYHFKQWGEWAPMAPQPQSSCPASGNSASGHYVSRRSLIMEGGQIMEKFGKHAAGRLLDGREWQEFPSDLHLIA